MKVLLINTPRIMRDGNIWKKIDRSLPSLGLAYIASFLRSKIKDIDIKILDMPALGTTFEDLKKLLLEFNPDFVGITASTVQVNSAFKLAEFIKSISPDCKIVLGGIHPSLMPEESLSKSFVDFVIRGEGEETFLNLVSGKNIKSILGLSYKSGGKIIHNKNSIPIQDLDKIPFPAYDLLPMKLYRPSLGNYKRLPAISVLASRGCPGQCTFCSNKFAKKYRFRSYLNIIEEIELLINNYGIKEISFYDDTFSVNKDNVMNFCREIIQRKIDITWVCMSRINCVDEELLKMMAKAGCHQVGYGIESSSPEILKNIKKYIPLEKVKDVFKWTQNVGMDARAMFMFGNPGETKETIKNTIKFALDIKSDLVIFNITTPFPGTEMFNWAKEKGYLNTFNWDDYDLSKVVMDLPTINTEDILYYYKTSYKRFYMRPSYILQRLLKIRSFNDIRNNFRSFSALIQG